MKKQTSYIGIAKSACALLLCLAMLVCMVPPVQVSAADTDASAVFVGEDTETKGAWEGKYGKDTAYLVGYNYDVATNQANTDLTARFAAYCSTYDKMIQSSNSKVASVTNATSRFWAWKAPADDDVVLDMPSGSNLTPFYAYAKDGYSTKFTVTATDEAAVHAFTVYGTQYANANSPRNDITVTITDENGTVLLTETLSKDTFVGGKYLTYNVTGSFVFTLSENGYDEGNQQGGFGVNAVFIDAQRATNATFATLLAGGGSVSLAENIVSNDPVVLPAGTVLDLNGYELTTPSVIGADGSMMIDTSSNVSGRINCAQGSLVLSEDNGYLPIWDGEAYLLAQPRMTDAYFNLVKNSNGFVITTRPGFGRSNDINVATYLASADNGVTMNFVLSWKDIYGNEGSKAFVLNEKLVREVYQSVGAENYAFQGTFSNPGDAQWYRVDVKLESCGVVVDSSNIATDAIKYDNPNDDNKTYLFAHDFNEEDLAWENDTLAGKRGSNITSKYTSGSYDYPTFDGTSMILNGGGNVNIVNLPTIASMEAGTKLVIEADVALKGGSDTILWLGTSNSAAYSKITSGLELVSYNDATGTAASRNNISDKFVIRSEIQKGADSKYTITTSILGTDIQHTVTGTSLPTILTRRNRNAATMTLDYLIIYTETTNG